MYILEGRGKGASWALLKATVKHQGMYVGMHDPRGFVHGLAKDMLAVGEISNEDYDYLLQNTYSFNEYDKTRGSARKPVFLDNALHYFGRRESDIRAIALSNEDEQMVEPKDLHKTLYEQEIENLRLAQEKYKKALQNYEVAYEKIFKINSDLLK